MIISVHLPRTAGTSFGKVLKTHFRTRLLRDYSDFTLNTPQSERNRAALQASLRNAESDFPDVECIHGHFLPIKYLLLVHKRQVKFVTWMRNPVERFCLSPELKIFYSQFLWGFPLDYFDFIGITEFYEDDIAYFGQHYLGANTKVKRLNVRTNSAYQIDRSFRNEIEAFHDRDMDLYRKALAERLT